jgi:hypothetical protein
MVSRSDFNIFFRTRLFFFKIPIAFVAIHLLDKNTSLNQWLLKNELNKIQIPFLTIAMMKLN